MVCNARDQLLAADFADMVKALQHYPSCDVQDIITKADGILAQVRTRPTLRSIHAIGCSMSPPSLEPRPTFFPGKIGRTLRRLAWHTTYSEYREP